MPFFKYGGVELFKRSYLLDAQSFRRPLADVRATSQNNFARSCRLPFNDHKNLSHRMIDQSTAFKALFEYASLLNLGPIFFTS